MERTKKGVNRKNSLIKVLTNELSVTINPLLSNKPLR
jgi:hypothetical protein